MDHSDEANDNELSDLLESTLGDFFKPSPSSSKPTSNATSSSTGRTFGQLPSGSSPFDQFTKKNLDKFGKEGKGDTGGGGDSEEDQSDIDEADAEKVKQRLDEILNDFIEKEPQLREHWQKLSKSCQMPAGSEEAFDTLNETMKSLSESAKSINNEGDISEEELSRLWNKLGISAEGDQNEEGVVPEVFSLVTNLMQNLLSKQVLYPSIKDLSERYPAWIDEHRNELDETDLERYTKQLNLMKQVCIEFESENESDPSELKDSRFQKILKIMQEMKDCGSPPKELVGDVPDIGSDLDFSKLSEMAGGGPSEQGCSIM